MSLTNHNKSLIIVDATIPALFTISILFLKYIRKINLSLFLTYFWGIFIGCLWEIPFGLLGDQFLMIKCHNPLGFSIFIFHAIWDSIIYLIGIYFIHIRNKNKYGGLRQLSLLVLWGILQNFLVELVLNNNYWYYQTDNKYNPVLFTINNNSFTYAPFMVWIVTPILYLSGVFAIIEKYGPLCGNRIVDEGRTNLLEDNQIAEINSDNINSPRPSLPNIPPDTPPNSPNNFNINSPRPSHLNTLTNSPEDTSQII